MEKSTESISGNTKTIMSFRVFGGVDCQMKLADVIDEDLKQKLPDSILTEKKTIEVVKESV
jgi:hypothetical protein